MISTEAYKEIVEECKSKNVTLVAVSKTKPVEDILALYELGQRDFGENYVQELLEKQEQLPKDIRWHFIGHLQSNKVKHVISFICLIHGVDSFKLLKEINKQAAKINRTVDCLLQVHIAQEETKFGLDENELNKLIGTLANPEVSGQVEPMDNVVVKGLMGMASFTNDTEKIRNEFRYLRSLKDKYTQLQILSMGMTADYRIAIEEGSNMIRIGSLIFGERSPLKSPGGRL